MQEKKKQTGKKKQVQQTGLPFSGRNYIWMGAGLAVILLGYISLAQGPVNSFWSLTLAPVLLVIGYCVLMPIGILLRNKTAG
ncbi:hypothetical protein ISS30_10760 [bacterium]|nr:hypothetical protein [bacterium]